MLESMLGAMAWVVSNWTIAGVRPQPQGNENFTASPSGTFRTASGLLNIAANQQRQFETLCGLLGRPELARDPRFAERENRKRHRLELNAEIERALAARTAAEWSALLNASDVPAGEVLDVPAILQHPQVMERGLRRTFDDVSAAGRAIEVMRSGFRLGSGDPGPASPPPALGADTKSVLADLGYSDAEIEALASDGAI
jgi:crotonobetainyl-CoA:carnitine CoA-transferase CaiB-like acyl-CoA transferase